MNDLISRQDAIEAIYEAKRSMAVGDISDYALSLITTIGNIPSAEPKKGEWVDDGRSFPSGFDWVHCSICGKKEIKVPSGLTNFCPNCGAYMRDEE